VDHEVRGAAPPGPPASSVPAERPQPPGPVAAPRTRRTRLVLLLVVSALLCPSLPVTTGAAYLVWDAHRSGRPAIPLADLTPDQVRARDRAVAAALADRAAALKARDRKAFLAGVDRLVPGFVAEQGQLFDNLAQLEFDTLTFEPVPGAEYSRPDLAARYGGRVHLPAVVLRYAIKGYDEAPLARPLVYTFVQRGSRWLLAGDADVDAQLPPGGHADPWDLGPMSVVRGKRSLVLGDAKQRSRLRDIAAMADDAVGEVTAMWPDGWARRVVVFASGDPKVINTYFHSALQDTENTAAIAVPAWGDVYGWLNTPKGPPRAVADRVILNPENVALDDPFLPHLLRHEISHVATRPQTLAEAPTWLVEGAAEYTAFRGEAIAGDMISPEVARLAGRGPVRVPGSVEFYLRDLDAHYEVAWLACAFVADRYGEARLRQLYRRLGGVTDITADEPATSLRAVLGLTEAEFYADLGSFVRAADHPPRD
jgi:hypothetical protein